MARFGRPFVNQTYQDQFGLREVGMSHPDNSSYFRIRDGGDIELVVSDGCGMVFNAKKRTITLIADEIRFLTGDGNTIRWNNKRFNTHAVVFNQPSLLEMEEHEQSNLYAGAEYFYETTS